jgi:hypothetical protein
MNHPPLTPYGPDDPRLPADDGRDRAGHRRPSEAATADIEERQEPEGEKDAEPGRPPEDAPAY